MMLINFSFLDVKQGSAGMFQDVGVICNLPFIMPRAYPDKSTCYFPFKGLLLYDCQPHQASSCNCQ